MGDLRMINLKDGFNIFSPVLNFHWQRYYTDNKFMTQPFETVTIMTSGAINCHSSLSSDLKPRQYLFEQFLDRPNFLIPHHDYF